jgi:adhesin/invasin
LGGTLTATTNASGVATFTNLSITGAAGPRTLSFSATNLTSATSATVTVGAGAATQLTLTTQPSPAVQSGQVFPQQPVVQLRDGAGNAVSESGVVVTAAIATGGGTLGGTLTAATNASGVATFTNLSITGLAGDRTLSFGATGLTEVTSTSIGVTAGAASALSITTQPSAAVQSGQAFPQQPVLQVRDGAGNAVSQGGVVVTAAIATGGGTLGGTLTATTNASGVATFTNLSVTGAAGPRTLSFNATELTSVTSASVTVGAGAATQLAINVQPSTSAQSGVALPQQPSVQLQDASGNPVAQSGVVVTAAIATGGGTLGGTLTATTNASGVATFTNLSITGLVGDRTLSFGATGLTGVTSNAISLTAGPAAALALTVQPSSSAQSGVAFPQQPVLQARDGAGNPVAQSGRLVTTVLASGSGTLGGTLTVATDANGTVTFADLAITGAAGAYTLRFESSSPTVVTPITSNTITLGAGTGAKLALTTPPSTTVQSGVPFPQQPVVQLQDASGNPVAQSGVVVAATILSGGGALSGTTTVATNASGAATFADLAIAGTMGTRRLIFAADGYQSVTSGDITVTAGPASQLAMITQPSATAQSGVVFPQQPTVQLRDASGNAVAQAGVSVTTQLALGSGTLGGTNTVLTNASGAAVFTNLSITGTVGPRTLSFAGLGLTGVTSSTISLVAGIASQLSVTTQPSATVPSGQVFPQQPVLQLRDAGGNVVSQGGVEVTAGIASGGGTLGGTLAATTNASGVATFANLNITGTVGDRTLAFSAPGLTGATSNTVTVTTGVASQLSITTQPSATAQSGQAFPQQPVLRLRDAGGNVVSQSDVVVTATIASGAGTLGGTLTATTNEFGVAAFTSLAITGVVGERTLQFTSGLLTPAISNTVTVTAGAASASTSSVEANPEAIAASSGSAQAVITVTVRDASGNAVPGATVELAATGTGNTLDQPSGPTDANGQVTGTLSSTAAEAKSVTATVNGSLALTDNALVTVTAGPAGAVAVSAGNDQSATVGTAVAVPPAVLVTDGFGNPVSGVSVTFAVASGGGTVDPTTAVVTNASGIAAVTSWTLGPTVGTNTVTATVGALTPVTFTATGTAGTATQLAVTTQPPLSVQAGVAFGVVVQLRDAQNNPVLQSGTTVTASLSQGTGVLGGTLGVTDASGLATFSGLTIAGLVGTYRVGFAATGLTGATTRPITLETGPATRLTITTQPSATVQAGQVFPQQPVVQLRDAGGNPVPQSGVSVSATIASGEGTLTGALGTTNGSGVAAFADLVISGVTGDRTLEFSSGVLTPVTSNTVTVTAGSASAATSAVTATPTTGIVANGVASATITVTVLDGFGNPVEGATVELAASGSGNTLTQPAAPTGANGQATGALASTTAETKTVTATVNGSVVLVDDASVTFVAGAAAGVAASGGDNQTAPVGTAVAVPPSVLVTDGSGNPVSGVSVTFAVASGGGTVDPTTPVATNAAGIAAVTSWTLGTTAGTNTVTATVSGLTPVTFTATGTAGAASGATTTIEVAPASVTADGVSTAVVTVTVRDASGNPRTGGGDLVELVTTLGTLSAVTDEGDGTYTATLTSGTSTGTATITGTVNALAITDDAVVGFTAGPAVAYEVTVDDLSPVAGTDITVTAQLIDAFGNPVAQESVEVTWSSTNGGSFSSLTSLTNASGIATVTFTTETTPSTAHVVTASDSSARTGDSPTITTQ